MKQKQQNIKNQGKEEYQSVEKHSIEMLQEMSILDLSHAILEEQNEEMLEEKCKVFVDRLLQDETVYDTILLKDIMLKMPFESVYLLAKKSKEPCISFLAALRVDAILDASFEALEWEKEGDLEKTKNQKQSKRSSHIQECIKEVTVYSNRRHSKQRIKYKERRIYSKKGEKE